MTAYTFCTYSSMTDIEPNTPLPPPAPHNTINSKPNSDYTSLYSSYTI